MESIDKDKVWIKSMDICGEYLKCHQMADRSFFIGKYQLPLCARCTGIVLGHMIAAITALFIDIPYKVLTLIIPMAVDGGTQYLTKYRSTNIRRLITGILYGFSITTTIFHTVRVIVKKVAA